MCVIIFRHRIWPGEGSTVQWKWFSPSPGSLKALLFPPIVNKAENKGTQGVRARYDAELPPFISIVRYPGRPSHIGHRILGPIVWGSPKASHIKASHPHFPRFRVRIFRVFRVFVLRSLLRPLFSWGERDVRIFRIFPVSGLNRWFWKSDRPALGWPALPCSAQICQIKFLGVQTWHWHWHLIQIRSFPE